MGAVENSATNVLGEIASPKRLTESPALEIYEDCASGRLDARPGLDATLKALRTGDIPVVWKLDRLGRNLRHLVNTVHDLTKHGVGYRRWARPPGIG